MEVVKWLWFHRKSIGVGIAIGGLIVLALFGAATWHGFERGDFLALMQVTVDLLMFPITVWGFLFVVHEFRKSQAKPVVDLFVDNLAKEVVLIRPTSLAYKTSEVYLVLRNTGTSVARWFSVEIKFSKAITVRDFYPRVGGYGSESQGGKWLDLTTGEGYLWSYQNDGQTAIYLDYPLTIALLRLDIYSDRQYEAYYDMLYTIASDWSNPVTGKLLLRIVTENDPPHYLTLTSFGGQAMRCSVIYFHPIDEDRSEVHVTADSEVIDRDFMYLSSFRTYSAVYNAPNGDVKGEYTLELTSRFGRYEITRGEFRRYKATDKA